MATLEIKFVGQDGVGSIVNNISAEFNTLNETTNKAKESGTGFFSGMLSTASGFLAANVIGGITSQVKDFIGGSIADARESAQIFAQTEAAIKSTGGAAGVTAQQVQDMAGSFSAAAGMSLFDDDDIQKGDNLLLTFTNIKETLPQATGVMVDMATAMHTDAAGGAIQLGKALNDPEKGITALTRVGVTFTEQQKDQIKALQESGDMAGAQTIILNELNKEFGGSAAAAAKADGGMAQFKAQLGDVGKQIGGALLPAIGQLTSFATTNLMPVIKEAATWFADNLPSAIRTVSNAIGPLVSFVGDLIVSFQSADEWSSSIEETFATLTTEVIGFATGMKEGSAQFWVVQGVIQSVIENIEAKIHDLSDVWAELQPVITNVVNAIGQVISAVFGVVDTFIKAHGADIKATMVDAWTQIQEIIKLGIELYNAIVPPVLRAIAGFITAHGAQIQAILSATWNAIKAVIDVALTLIKGIITVALDLIHGDWSKAWEDIKTMSARIVEDLISIIRADLDILKTVFGGAIKWIQDEWTALPGQLAGVGNAIVKAVQDGFESAWENFKASMLRKLKELRDQLPFSEPKDSSSPLYGLSTSGRAIVGNLQSGIDNAPKLAIGGALAIGNARASSGGSSGHSGAYGEAQHTTVHIVVDDRKATGLLKGVITAKVDSAGAKALSRIRTGN